MNFDPNAAPETPDLDLLPEGDTTLVVLAAEETVSAAGNDMIRLTLGHYGKPCETFRDFLVGTEAALWKVRQFAAAAGLLDEFNSGKLTDADCIGRLVRARIMHETDPGYPPQAKVAKYLQSDSDLGVLDSDRLAAACRAHGLGAPAAAKVEAAPANPHAHPDYDAAADNIPF